MKKPELLSPAGDLEKLKTAVAYGADAVYIGGQNFGLRANAKNFDLPEMEAGIEYAHSHGVKVYVTANIFAHNPDLEGLERYFPRLAEIGADGVIISDLGVMQIARETAPDLPIHVSTQANTTNFRSVQLYKSLGARRIVLARELSFEEIAQIRAAVPDIELEVFVHGAMCMAYSGRCLLSSYMTGRDANRGDCAQPCRWEYYLTEQTREGEHMPVYEDERGTYIFNSKDLCMIEYMAELDALGIDSYKIEGRMKTPYYVATVTKTYRDALDTYHSDPAQYAAKKGYFLDELKKSSHRHFTTGFFNAKPDACAQNYETSAYVRTYDFIAVVLSYDENTGLATLEQRNKFSVGDVAEVMPAKGDFYTITITEMYDESGERIHDAPHARQIVKIPVNKPLSELDILRK